LAQIEELVGHSLQVKDSEIDHHEAGQGVFMSCHKQGIVLPGTLVGLFGGVINHPSIPVPETPKRSMRPYLKRFDGYWIDYEKELPYPLPSPGDNF